jgi:hypothetical protein
VTATHCRFCGLLLASPSAHIPTPGLRGPGDEAVYWCVTAQRHLVVPLRWSVGIRRSLRSLWEGM